MKKAKKLIALIMSAAMILSFCVPFASAQEEAVTEITQETPEESVVQEQEKDYSEKTEEIFNDGLTKLERGGLMLACFAVSPIVILFPMTTPVGIMLLLQGLPVGLSQVVIGLGEVIGAPIIAVFS